MTWQTLLYEWANFVVRWIHVIAAIAWIGSSFYFVHLDLSLRRRPNLPAGVGGDAWQVHGGGFYHMLKYLIAPPHMPEELTWFKWEAYFTFLSGFLLLSIIYYLNADLYLIDKTVWDMPQWLAVALAIAALAGGWLIYDLLYRTPLADNDNALLAVVFALLVAAAFGLTKIFSGRGAFMELGAIIGTIMVANVAMNIMPNQRKTVAALLAGQTPNPAYGKAAKQRSLHNNYLTLPALFLMLSNHYPLAFATRWNWAIAGIVIVIGAVIRHFYNSRHAGKPSPWWTWG
ncbi:MAG: urate hydroxylase PuuD, partial [Methylobacteriaceae bacterium]|nr:urate hydroxylase PuuD [Methylobacteriaceae bacterium]